MTRILGALTALAVLAACAKPVVQAPQATDEELEQEFVHVGGEMMSDLLALRKRVKNVEYALTTSASRHCGKLSRPRAGAVVATIDAFRSESLKELASRDIGLAESPAILHVVPGGPAERAGLRPGDVLLVVAGQELASPAQLSELLTRLDSRASVRLVVSRGGIRRELDLGLAPACPIFFDVVNSATIVPWQRHKFVIEVPVGLLRVTDSDDVLGVALGHQLAHALFERREDDVSASEARADRLGVMLAAEAGFDVRVAPGYWERVAREYPWLVLPPSKPSAFLRRRNLVERDLARYPHHDIARRMSGLRAAIAEFGGGLR